jgi:hypothetical protein
VSWQNDARPLLDNLAAAYTGAVKATDDKDRHTHLVFAKEAASQLSWLFDVALMEATIWEGDSWRRDRKHSSSGRWAGDGRCRRP